MQTILSKEQIKLLNSHHIDYKQFINNEKPMYPRIKRQIKHYGLNPKVAWNADNSILLLAWLNIQQSHHHELTDDITYVLNYEYYVNDEDFLDVEIQARKDISNFYNQLSELKDFQFLSWFFCHTDSILKIYKYDTKKVIDLTFHQFEINTPDFKLKGSQEFALNWLLERIQIIIKYNYRPEDVRKFFLVWAEVHPMFWW